uniref:Reverse transcriptase domain-containing protein n=1 Tax=Tanacetum cinerariifolium TaxID=118510 RepID=A0A699H836_TANCI|nr:reverse transcriptase domain-containing protein [Tanacetum cinerariifolium]
MANTTHLVTTVTKPATNPRDTDTTPRVNIQEFCEEYYEDILPMIMDKVRHDRRKDVHTRLDSREGLRERTKEDSHHSNARARTTKPERVKVQDCLRYGDRHVLDRLGHRRQSAFDRLSETYSPSTTKSRPRETDSKDPPRGRSRTHGLNTSREDRPKDRERFRSIGESYDDSFSHSYQEDPFTPRIRIFESSRKTRMPNNVKTYDGTGDPEDHVKNFQAAAQVERWAMPTWCHMFNSTLIGEARVWFDELPPESIDSYKDLKAAFLAYFMQQNKYVKDPVEIHNIKQKDGETIEDFMKRFKVETGRMKRAPECMRISGFMHEVNNLELTKRLNEHVPKTMKEMMITTTTFIRGEAAVASKKKGHATPKEILTAEAGKFQPPPPMVTLVEKRSINKFCDFHNDKGDSTDECMQLKKQIEELVRAGKLSHLIKEIKHGRDQSKTGKKETAAKDKPAAIYMIQSGTERPLVIEAEMDGHMIHRMYVDGGSSMEILYEHCFNRLRPEIKSQLVPATTSLTGFSGETIWPLGQLRLLVIVGDTNHSTRAWMNFMIVRLLSPYNSIIGRPGIRAIQAVPSTVHEMLKFPVEGGIVTIHSTVLIPTECTSVITSSVVSREERTRPANFKVALHPDFPDQEVAIGGTLLDKGRTEMCSILKKNLDIFSWQPSDMTGVPRSVAEHRLNIREGYSLVRQKKGVRPLNVLKPYKHSWRMCVDFTDLNKACSQDCYPLLEIDWKVESLCEGMFLGYVVTPEGIKPCPDKTADVLQLPSPRTIKEVQSLNGKLASLNRFLSKSAEKSLPLFQTLKNCIIKSDFHWSAEVEQAFKQLKQHLSELPLLVAPKPKEELIIYLSATYEAISAVLMTERGTVQTPIYFISRALQGPELNYSPMEKLVLSLVFAAKRLRRYFQADPITVITDQPIKQVTSRPDVAGRLQKWSIMLREHNITCMPRTSVKGQILADFLIEMPGENLQAAPAAETQQEPWTLFTDGSSSEYEALIAGPRIAARMGVKDVHVSVDSKLVANYVLGTYVAKEDNMVKYLKIVKSLVSGFTTFSISQVPRSKNKKADALSKIALTSFAHLSKQVLVEVLKDKSIKEKEVATVIEEDGPTWMTPIVDYLQEGTLPGDKKEARKLRLKARQYELMEGILYRRSFLTPWLRCVGPLQAEYVMREIHEGSCSMHAGPRLVVAKAIRLGYYWPTMHRDAHDMIRKCNDCQIHRPITRSPQQPLTPITAPWPFYKWGIDITGPFPKGPGKVKFLIVAMDYFTKWIEGKAVATITGGQSNGLVERANRSLGEGIKSRLGEGNKNWVEELSHVLWAHRTMIKSSHGDTPFSLTYGTKAVIPTEIGMPTYRTAAVDMVSNDEELRLNLDLLEERRKCAAICEANAKSKITKYYNARVRSVTFKPGDFVYRSNDANHAVAGGKLGPKWEGPYEVTEALGDGAYKLQSMDGTILPRTWNIANLKRCYL